MHSIIQFQLVQTIFIKTWRPYLWIAISSLLLYGHVIFFSEYTYYDDDWLIKDNFSKIDEVSDVGRQFLEDVAHQPYGGNIYRPLLNVTFILGTQISGIELWGQFLINVLLHTSSCLLLFIMLLNLGVSRAISFLLSFIFTIHPALTQSVAWLAGRNDSLLAFFLLTCFISFLKYLSSESYTWYFAHLFFFACALFTKETTIVFPFVLLFYIYFIHKDKVRTTQIIGLLLVWIVVFVNWYIIRSAARTAPFSSPLKVVKNLMSDLYITFYYFEKIFWPVHLTFGPLKADVDVVTGILSVIVLLGIIVLSTNRNWKIIVFGFLWFGLFLIPTFVYHPRVEIHVPYYEHRVYVPMIGIVILLSSLSLAGMVKYLKPFIPILLGFIIVFFSWKSYSQTYHFRNFITLRQYAAESSPHDRRSYSPMERMNLPLSLKQQIMDYKIPSDAPPIDVADTIKNSRRTRDILEALESKYKNEISDKELLHSLAIVNYARGFFVRAEELFLYAKKIDPQNADIPYNLGILFYDAHRYIQTEREWLLSLEMDPSSGNAYINLTYLYYEQGEFEKAWKYCQVAVKRGIIIPDGLIKEITGKLQVQEKSVTNNSKG